jgi:hypothetical protein
MAQALAGIRENIPAALELYALNAADDLAAGRHRIPRAHEALPALSERNREGFRGWSLRGEKDGP